ncbi:GIY-YIG nuclease family protein [Iningainema tapete]|uniref:GIY-YIG nuclease family protein n=1 Tax=Iningainema tapete BLCC-T55 TaxID=2748662 RepID=A0A8J6XJD2_9CYAN|nr:GIY-YIG nuclease family protein [Iningainema tapete]MBD2772564.1 GIY-YIG nuclease family protein [Iningainema tapete BLCC-T55]
MNIELSELPSLALNARQYLPTCTCIYIVLNSLNQVLYVGKASNLQARWLRHHRFEQLNKINKKTSVRIAWIVCDEVQLNQLELYYIEKYCPLLNKTSVEARKIIPSQTILGKSLEKIAKYAIVFGIFPRQGNDLPTIVIRYFWYGYHGIGKETRIIRRSLRALNKQSSSLKWVEFVRRTDAAWWKCKCTGYQIELGPVHTSETSVTRRGLNDDITFILLKLAYGEFSSLTMEQLIAVKDVTISLNQVGDLLRSHPDGLINFPLQSHAQLIKIASVDMLALTPTQLNEIKESYPNYASLTPILDDPIKFFYEKASPPRPLRSKPLKDW